jgi:hypothetical protein
LSGASERFIPRNREVLKKEFDDPFQDALRQYWKEKGVTTGEEYANRMSDAKYLEAQYPGEVLECKVNPEECLVGDMEYVNRVADDVRRGWTQKEAVQFQSKEYWKHLITLEDFLKWYKKPEWAEDGNTIVNADGYRDGEPFSTLEYYPIKGAPEDLPESIHVPEVLIPHSVPPQYIRVVKN